MNGHITLEKHFAALAESGMLRRTALGRWCKQVLDTLSRWTRRPLATVVVAHAEGPALVSLSNMATAPGARVSGTASQATAHSDGQQYAWAVDTATSSSLDSDCGVGGRHASR